MNVQRQPFGVQNYIVHILITIKWWLELLKSESCKPGGVLILGLHRYSLYLLGFLELVSSAVLQREKKRPPLEVRLASQPSELAAQAANQETNLFNPVA